MANHYTDKTYYEYDQTLTQSLLTKYINTLSSSTATKTDQTYLWNAGTMSHFTGSRHTPNPEIYSGESEEPRPSTVTHYYVNFTEAVNVNFDEARSAASAAGVDPRSVGNGITLMDDGTYATNITFANGGAAYADGNDTRLTDLTFTNGGNVYLGGVYDEGEGNQTRYYAATGQKLNGLRAKLDFDELYLQTGASASATDVVISRNMRALNIANDSGNHNVENRTGSGTVVDSVTVSGKLDRVHVGSGASLNMLTVGTQRNFTSADRSAFGYFDSNWNSWTYSSATWMEIASGGTASNIYLGNGGSVFVSGPSDTVTSAWNGTKNEWEYTTHYASGTGGILTNLQMAISGGLQFEGVNDPRATWVYPSNGYSNSSSYMSGFLATAPQSAYVWFGSNASGSNINIGKGGSLYIDKDAHVSAISMGGLTTSTTFVNSSGTTDTWIGDRGASLQIRGGKVSGVVMDPVLQTFDYYSAAHDYFWLYSSSLKSEYYSSHNSTYPSGAEWSSSVLDSAVSGGYRQYMSAMYTSGAVYTNLGDDTAYERRYVGGTVNVNGGWIMNVSGFSYLGVAADVDVTVSNHVSSWKTYQYTDGNVSKAIGAVSATLDVTGGAHVYNVKIEGGCVIMTGGGEVNARWHSRENKQSNYNLVEDLDLRIGDVLGFGSAYPAVIEFFGEGSGGYSQYISSGGTSGYVDYTWDAIDPGEIHSATASKGLVVSANWNKQDFTYIGSGAVTFNGLGTVVLKDNHSRYSSDSYYGTGPYLGSAFDTYYFGVVKGVYNEEDGVLENYTVLDGDVSSGGFDWEGFLMVGSGGIVRNIGSAAPLKTGNDIVNSDTWTPEYTRDKCKVLTVVAGGLADNVTVKGAVSNFEHFESQYTESRAGLLVSSGGTATNVTVLEGGIAMAKGGTIDKVFVAAGGVLYLSGWAGAHQVGERDSDGHVDLSGPQYMDTTVLNGVRLDSGGQLTNTLDYGFRKGNAPSVIANKGGGIMNGVTANGVAYVSGLDFAGNITLTKDQQAIDVTVRGYKTITSRDDEGNPTAYNTTIAYMNVSSGGIVKGATVGEEGAIYVSNGADVSGLVASGGRIIFANSSGWSDYFAGSATVNGITVKDGGELEVNSKFGLTATNVKIEQDAGLTFTLGKTANEDYTPTTLNGTWTADWGNGTFQTNDGVLTGFGGQFGHEYRDLFYSSAYVSARLSMTIVEGGVLAGGDLRGYGSVLVKNGGKMLDTKLQGVGASIATSGYASGLSATIASGKNAYGTNIYVYGEGAVAEATVLNGGYMGVERGGVVNSVTMLCPEGYEGPAGNDTEVGPVEFEVMAGGTASNVIASAGVVTLYEGSKVAGMGPATLSNAEIHSSAMLLVNADGVVLDGTLKVAGSVVTTAERYEYVEVEVTDPDTNETYTDWQRVPLNNAVADAKTLTVSFDLTEHAEGFETALIDNMANLDGAKYEFIYVNENQAAGSYVLAGNAQDYKTGALKVVRGGKFAGTITVSDGWGVLQVDDDLTYTVNHNANNELVFSVENTDAVIENIVATSNGKELLKGKWSKYSVNIKTEVNKYTTSIWYRIKQAVKTRGRGVEDEEGWLELDNENGLDITEYCTVELKAKNEAGADSEIVEYTVNYDATAPEFSDMQLFSGEPFLTPGEESEVTVQVWDELDEAPKVELSFDGEQWTELVLDEVSRTKFKVTGGVESFTLRATDHADNVNTLVISSPAAPVASADIITVTNQDVTVSAEFGTDAMIKEFSTDGGQTWEFYDNGVVLKNNGTVSFRAGNIIGYSDVISFVVGNIDKEKPEAPTASADITTPTNGNVTVTAKFSDDSVKQLYTLDGGETWADYDEGGVIIIINGTVGFCGVDAAGNTSDVTSLVVNNIDKEKPVITLSGDNRTPLQSSTLAASTEDGVDIYYSLDEESESWTKYEGEIPVTANGTFFFRAIDAAGNTGTAEYVFKNIIPETDVVPQTQTWEKDEAVEQYIVEYSTDNFEHVIRIAVASNALDSFQLPAGTYQWRVKAEDGAEWSEGQTLVSEEESDAPAIVQSNEDGNEDLFFATTSGTWRINCSAQHIGSINDWTGTGETVSATGRGRIRNLFFGSADPNVLCLTDGENGDAIFVDDVYTSLPEGMEDQTSRLYRIKEIRAGAGDDIVDMTSQRFEYTGDGLSIHGGDGDDVIWANRGDNLLFGDAGNDGIIGASGNDVIAGGIGIDSMHGGGGDDVFTFCDNWGEDAVEQLETGSVTLWFASGSESNWDAETRTYTDGNNSVKVYGVTADKVTLKFGDDGSEQYAGLASAGAFAEFSSQKIFEDSANGFLA
jgi:hypothetical protein